ncbi:hypothetical protein [Haloarcula pellucida]|uniref:Uncharacterized protein n=1 Tax=Haloarcula pellucida TaxID=1427151 RepID=A0A830GR48_9EURY|nr:hypothetical protein [Halomicroarcula pellucida]MBX0348238.1 hypothetical protein [Halomicroarcula pellucida]GGN97634.1 hypothetical protein GCM10009030_27080 [Halomicroarcula pellucida]
MGLDTRAEVGELQTVQNEDGDKVPPANESHQQAIRDAVGNPDGATIQTYSTSGTTPEPLPDLTIPDGVTALIVYLPGNSGDVYLGDDADQFVPLTDAGHVFSWEGSNVNDLYIKTNSAGDGVGIIFEGAQ